MPEKQIYSAKDARLIQSEVRKFISCAINPTGILLELGPCTFFATNNKKILAGVHHLEKLIPIGDSIIEKLSLILSSIETGASRDNRFIYIMDDIYQEMIKNRRKASGFLLKFCLNEQEAALLFLRRIDQVVDMTEKLKT